MPFSADVHLPEERRRELQSIHRDIFGKSLGDREADALGTHLFNVLGLITGVGARRLQNSTSPRREVRKKHRRKTYAVTP